MVSPVVVLKGDSVLERHAYGPSLAWGCACSLPSPFAVITVDGEQTYTTSVIKKTLNPYWNENFDM